jgi:hypothetical protein
LGGKSNGDRGNHLWKKRSDAKHNIKIKLDPKGRTHLRLNARHRGMSLTAFASEIIKIELLKDDTPPHSQYLNKGKFINLLVENELFEKIQDLSIQWDMSKREVVYQFIHYYLFLENGGIIINDFRGGTHEVQ